MCQHRIRTQDVATHEPIASHYTTMQLMLIEEIDVIYSVYKNNWFEAKMRSAQGVWTSFFFLDFCIFFVRFKKFSDNVLGFELKTLRRTRQTLATAPPRRSIQKNSDNFF